MIFLLERLNYFKKIVGIGDLIMGGGTCFCFQKANFLNPEFETKTRSNCVRTLPIRDERSVLHFYITWLSLKSTLEIRFYIQDEKKLFALQFSVHF